MTDLVIQNVRVVAPGSGRDALLDVHIQGGAIADLVAAQSLVPKNARSVDATGCVLLPGPIDLACTLNDPGREDIESMAQTLTAAARGGFTTVVAAPETIPRTETAEAVRAKLERMRSEGPHLDGRVAGALSVRQSDDHRGTTADDLAEIGLMARAGAEFFTNFPRPLRDLGFIRRALQTVSATGCSTLLWGAEPTLAGNAVVHESGVSTSLGVSGAPKAAEVIRAFALRELAMLSGAPRGHTVFGPVSTADTLRALQGPHDDTDVSVGALAAAWSLLLDESTHRQRPYDAHLALDPPLRSGADCDAMLDAARRGDLAITSGHRPRAPEEKEVEFGRAKVGGSGLELAIPALVQVGDVESPGRGLDPESAAIALSEIPAAYLGDAGKDLGKVRIGDVANVVVLSPGDGRPLGASDLTTPCKFSPYLGLPRRSRVALTVVQGRIVFDDLRR